MSNAADFRNEFMSKRHLSDQQKRRIAVRQDNFVMTKHLESVAVSDALPGLVIAQRGKQLEVETDAKQIITCHARQNIGAIVAGDQVRWCRENDDTVIVAREDRRSVLSRPDLYKQEKIIAANLDQMLIVLGATPEPIWHFLDKFLIAAELQGLAAGIVLNKLDLAVDLPALQKALSLYRQLGYACYEVSCKTRLGLDQVEQALSGKTSVFVGQSGVGKSSLINALYGQDLARIGELSEANHKGQHTTTTARLYHFPNGGELIDSPGIREFGLWHITPAQALRGFKEIYAYAGLCKFRDCQHHDTRGCAVEAAVAAGKIHAGRLESYRRTLSHLNET